MAMCYSIAASHNASVDVDTGPNGTTLVDKIRFKNVPSPVPICYCANVTDEEILYHVAVAKCCSSLDDIKKHTGANSGRECLTKNPAGG